MKGLWSRDKRNKTKESIIRGKNDMNNYLKNIPCISLYDYCNCNWNNGNRVK